MVYSVVTRNNPNTHLLKFRSVPTILLQSVLINAHAVVEVS